MKINEFQTSYSKDIDSIYSIEKKVFDDSWSYESIDYEITKESTLALLWV
ncbi:MAG: hypothetical protein Ct9H90mP7_4240 [Candidatus Neomarinimicrobiota bacterium]|nr:MAG: hypothetical protein Ct9H90mP7_4240 [Candidatus Neomarinimicrobiota bacterium]